MYEFYVDKTSFDFTNMNICDKSEVDMIAIPKKLQKIKKYWYNKYNEYDFGRFVQNLSNDVNQSLSILII